MNRPDATEECDIRKALATLRRMVGKAKVGMLTTITPDKELRSRPLHTEAVDDDGTLWFIVEAATPKVGEISAHGGKVCLTYCDIERQNYLSLTGTSHLVEDQARKSKLWSATAETWFAGRKQDPSVSLLKVVPERGEWWDRPGGAMETLFALTRVAVTGSTDSLEPGRKFEVGR